MTTDKEAKDAQATRLGAIGCGGILGVLAIIILIGALLSGGDDSPELPASCKDSPSCVVTIDVDDSIVGVSVDRELLDKQRDMWKQIAGRQDIQRAKVILEGATTDIAGNSDTSPLLAVTCSRQAFTRVNWDDVDPDGVKTLCDWSEKVKFD